MITLKQWMDVVGYRISTMEASCKDYDCFIIDFWDGNNTEGFSTSVTYDSKTFEVIAAEVHDYKREHSYRIATKQYFENHGKDEVAYDTDEAEILFIDLETDEDFLQKLSAIVNYEDYSTDISIPLNIPDDELLILMKAAHERNITFNQYMVEILESAIKVK